ASDPSDRRRVVVKLIPEAAGRRVAPVFSSLLGAWRDELAKYSDKDIGMILEFQRRALEIMMEQLTLMRHSALEVSAPANQRRSGGEDRPARRRMAAGSKAQTSDEPVSRPRSGRLL